jgi:hypothetical protein
MQAVDQWAAIEADLPENWAEARLSFEPEDDVAAAAAILAPLGPGRTDGELRILLTRAGSGPERLRNTLRRLDQRRVWGTLRLVDAREGAETEGAESIAGDAEHGLPETAARGLKPPAAVAAPSLVEAWDALVATLPPDWSDVLCELELDSSDHVARAALLGAPLNPTRNPDAIALRFRVSGKRGYGTAAGMTRRCFERMDAAGITGRLAVVIELSDADKAQTQGPVWRVAGRSV